MLSRAHRFHGLGSLKRVYQHGQTVRTPLLALRALPNERRRDYRVAVVVSRKVNKSAVVRNRLRRRVFEQVRLQAADITGPFDLVFTVFSEQLGELPVEKLQKLVADLLRRTGAAKS
jgi:ribonuclease P protein component